MRVLSLTSLSIIFKKINHLNVILNEEEEEILRDLNLLMPVIKVQILHIEIDYQRL